MQNIKPKVAIALVTIFTLSVLLIPTLPDANAIDMSTHKHNFVRPNPLGVGQNALVEICARCHETSVRHRTKR